jgi:hypothetical protein
MLVFCVYKNLNILTKGFLDFLNPFTLVLAVHVSFPFSLKFSFQIHPAIKFKFHIT